MKTSTVAPIPGGEIIKVGATWYTLETAADYANATGALKTVLDARALDEAVERELANMTERTKVRLRAQNAVPVVSAHAVMRAARAASRLTQVETWITNNQATNDLALRLKYGAENITQAELVAVDATQGAAIFAAARLL